MYKWIKTQKETQRKHRHFSVFPVHQSKRGPSFPRPLLRNNASRRPGPHALPLSMVCLADARHKIRGRYWKGICMYMRRRLHGWGGSVAFMRACLPTSLALSHSLLPSLAIPFARMLAEKHFHKAKSIAFALYLSLACRLCVEGRLKLCGSEWPYLLFKATMSLRYSCDLNTLYYKELGVCLPRWGYDDRLKY